MERNSLIINLNKLKEEKNKGELDFDRCLNIFNEIENFAREYNLKYKMDLNKEELKLYNELESTFEELNDIFLD